MGTYHLGLSFKETSLAGHTGRKEGPIGQIRPCFLTHKQWQQHPGTEGGWTDSQPKDDTWEDIHIRSQLVSLCIKEGFFFLGERSQSDRSDPSDLPDSIPEVSAPTILSFLLLKLMKTLPVNTREWIENSSSLSKGNDYIWAFPAAHCVTCYNIIINIAWTFFLLPVARGGLRCIFLICNGFIECPIKGCVPAKTHFIYFSSFNHHVNRVLFTLYSSQHLRQSGNSTFNRMFEKMLTACVYDVKFAGYCETWFTSKPVVYTACDLALQTWNFILKELVHRISWSGRSLVHVLVSSNTASVVPYRHC